MLDNQKFGKRLVQAGVISQAQLDEALRQQQVQEGRLGEILVRLGYVSEPTVLQFLAAEFRTRYVSTERLAKARIPQQVLDLLPVHIAERYNLIPVLFDSENSTLSIVTSDPQNEASLREVHMITRVRELRVYVALQSAVQAAIRKHYRGEINAFNQVQQGQNYTNYETSTESASSDYSGYESSERTMYVAPDSASGNYGGAGSSIYTPSGGSAPYDSNYDVNQSYADNTYGNRTPYETPPPNSYYGGQNEYNYNNQNDYYGDSYANDFDDDDVTRLRVTPGAGSFDANANANASYQYGESESAPIERGTDPRMRSLSPLGGVQVLALTRTFIERIEHDSERYKNHLSLQEPLLRMMLKRLDLPTADCDTIWMAFYLHHMDLPEPHPCLLSIAQDEELREKTEQDHHDFLQRVQRFQLPAPTMDILTHMYERFNGEGFPNQTAGTEIPIGARLLSLLDTYEDLRYQDESIEAEEIAERLRMHEGKLFDPELLELFEKEVFRIEKYLKGTISRVLLLDSDEEMTNELERHLLKRGLWIQTTADPSVAIELCKKERVDLVVLDLELPGDGDGFSFIEAVKECEHVPEFLIVTNENDNDKIEQGMSVARDYLIKSMGVNIIAPKINKQVQQLQKDRKLREDASSRGARRGLEGSLEEMGPPDILQVLSQGRRTGKLALSLANSKKIGFVYLDEGQVVNAEFENLNGEQAFYKVIGWERGECSFEPGVQATEQLISAPLDGLILDGLRMLDEDRRDGVDPFGELDFGEEEDFSGLADDDDDDLFSFSESGGSDAKKKDEPSQPEAGLDGIFEGLDENDLDSVFSSGFEGGKETPKS